MSRHLARLNRQHTTRPSEAFSWLLDKSGTLAPTGNANVGQVGGGAGSTLNVVVPSGSTFQAEGSWATNAPGASNAGGNLGTLNVSVGAAGGTGRFVLNANTSNVVNNVDRFGVNSLQNTALVLGDGITMFTRGPSGGNTITLGSLAGTSGAILGGGGQSGGTITTYTIGSLNTNTEFAGRITSENVLSFGSAAGGTSINKVGTGTLTLSGVLDYSPNVAQAIPNRRGGVTTITAGTLALRNGAVLGPGADQTTNPTTVDIRAGAILDVGTTGTYQSAANQQVIGAGRIAGNYNLAAGLLAPGNTINNAGAGTVTTAISNNPIAGVMAIDNFSVNGTGTIRFDLSNSPTAANNDRIDVLAGNMTGTPTLSLNFLAAPSPGTYTIVNSTGAALTGSLSGWTVGFAGRGTAPTLSFSGDSKQVLLNIGASSFGNINWQGGTDGNWDIQTTANWRNTAAGATNPDKYFESDNVNFLDTFDGTTAPSNNSAITLNVPVAPSSVTANNSAIDYTISGSGKITGAATLTKHGTGTFNLGTTNDYTGGTTIDGGTINLGSTGTLGSGQITMSGGTIIAQTTATTNTTPPIQLTTGTTNTLTINSGTTHILGTISGGGDLAITSDTAAKTIDTATANTATGHITVNGPILRLGGTGGGATAGSTIQWRLTGTGTIASGSSATQGLGSLEGDGGTIKGFSGGSAGRGPHLGNWQPGRRGSRKGFCRHHRRWHRQRQLNGRHEHHQVGRWHAHFGRQQSLPRQRYRQCGNAETH